MCGICGVAGEADKALIRRMTRRLLHRGRDDEGVVAESDFEALDLYLTFHRVRITVGG